MISKYILIILSIIAIGLLSMLIFNGKRENETMSKLKSSWYTDAELEVYDPAEVLFASDAQLLINIYDGLYELDNNNEIIPIIAESHIWHTEYELEIKIKQSLLTSTGKHIDAEDVFLNFKRLILLNKNTHGNLRTFLCTNTNHDRCDGLSYKNNSVYFKFYKKEYAKFFIELLTSPDFLIIPKESIDWKKENLPIIDYSNTTGAYYISKNLGKGKLILKKNAHNSKSKLKIPEEIEIIPNLDSNSVQNIKNSKIDLITSIDREKVDNILNLEKERFNVTKSHFLKGINLFYTKKGLQSSTIEDRIKLGKFIKENLSKNNFYGNSFSFSNQFFPMLSDGSLSEENLNQYKSFINSFETRMDLNKNFVISVASSEYSAYSDLFKDHKNIQIIKFTKLPFEKELSDQEDGFIIPSDVSFNEDISLISYYTKTSFFSFDKDKGDKWLSEYLSIENKSQRLSKLSDAHYNLLMKANIFPIGNLQYVSAAKKPFKFLLNKFSAASPFWKLTFE